MRERFLPLGVLAMMLNCLSLGHKACTIKEIRRRQNVVHATQNVRLKRPEVKRREKANKPKSQEVKISRGRRRGGGAERNAQKPKSQEAKKPKSQNFKRKNEKAENGNGRPADAEQEDTSPLDPPA